MLFWREGKLRDASEPAEAARLALSTLPCPTAWVGRPGTVAMEVASGELAHACAVLGHEPPGSLDQEVEQLAAQRSTDAELIQLAVVPHGPPPLAAVGTWPATRVVGWRATSPAPQVLRAVVAPWPLDERSPATPLRLTTRAETVAGRRHATAQGADAAVWLGLAGAVARVDDWSLVAVVDGRTVTPPTSAGAPTDRWTDRAVAAGAMTRAPIPSLDAAEALAALTPWGTAVPVVLDGRPEGPSRSLAAALGEALA